MDLNQYNFLASYRNKWYLLIDVFVLTGLGVFLLWISDLLKNKLQDYKFITDSSDTIKTVAFFLFLILLSLMAKNLWRLFASLHKSNCIYKFKSQDWPNEWIFNGKPEPFAKNGELCIKSSRAGCLIKNYQWKNLKITFDIKFNPSRTRPLENLGVIFRAENLDNYFMLEIIQNNPFDGKPITGLKPHVRFNGNWEMIDIEESAFDFSSFKKVCIEVEKDTVIFFYEDEPIFNWTLPTHVDINHIESGFKPDSADQKSILGKEVTKGVQEIPFRKAYGMAGFRAHPGQGAIIKNLKIEPL